MTDPDVPDPCVEPRKDKGGCRKGQKTKGSWVCKAAMVHGEGWLRGVDRMTARSEGPVRKV